MDDDILYVEKNPKENCSSLWLYSHCFNHIPVNIQDIW